jgi:hypothetical protein
VRREGSHGIASSCAIRGIDHTSEPPRTALRVGQRWVASRWVASHQVANYRVGEASGGEASGGESSGGEASGGESVEEVGAATVCAYQRVVALACETRLLIPPRIVQRRAALHAHVARRRLVLASKAAAARAVEREQYAARLPKDGMGWV